jgi:Ca2+-binding RTX toxin-like protein
MAGDDVIDGGDGRDLIVGGDGKDNLTGGSGIDTFLFDTALNAASNVDRVTDFNATNDGSNGDLIYLSTAIFAGIGSGTGTLAASDYAAVSSGGSGNVSALSVGTSVNIVYDSSTGGLFYDADGGSLVNAIKFAVIDPAGLSGTFDNGDIKFGP